MSMLQQYYTSCTHGLGNGSGFQTKAQSNGLSTNDLQIINSMIGYRIPPSADEHNLASHPIALRYDYLAPDKCILVCSQSNGTDENERPGNFFAHSVITSPNDFNIFPPIMFWRNPFWKTKDASAQTEIASCPSFEIEPSLQFEQIWPFINSGERHAWFHKLLAATINYGLTKRPIIILDQIDNIALWIACVTLALPKIYRNYLTFATYHHDPYQVPYMITGTTRDSKFRFTSDEYITYFILNAEQGRISDVEDSNYARFVSDNFSPEIYETKLVDFFEICNHRLPPRRLTNMKEVLKAATDAYVALREKSAPISTDDSQLGLQSFIQFAESQIELYPEDLQDLNTTVDLLGAEMLISPTISIVQNYSRVLRLLKKHNQQFPRRARSDIEYLTGLLLKGNEGICQTLLDLYRYIYEEETISQILSQPEYIESLAGKFVSIDDILIHKLFWKNLMPFIKIDASNELILALILHKSLSVLEKMSTETPDLPPANALEFLEIVIQSIKSNTRFLLRNGLTYQQQSRGKSFFWLYYKLIGSLSISERKAYRNQVYPELLEIVAYEIRRDVYTKGADKLIPVLLNWIENLGELVIQNNLVSATLQTFWPILEEKQRKSIATNLLNEKKIIPLLEKTWKRKIVADLLVNVQMAKVNSELVAIYREFLFDSALSDIQKAILGGSLAMTIGEFQDNESVVGIQKGLSAMPKEQYQIESKKLIERFFAKNIDPKSHRDMLQATYVLEYEGAFWDSYWHYFKGLFLNADRYNETIAILKFWFDESPAVFEKNNYLSSTFFLDITTVIKEMVKERDYDHAISQINRVAKNDMWYALFYYHVLPAKKASWMGGILKK